MIASCGDNSGVIKLWRPDGTLLRELSEHAGFVWSVAFSRDGEMLVSAGADRTVKVWDVSSGARIRSFSGNLDEVYDAAFTASGSSVVSVAKDGRVFAFGMNSARRELERAASFPLYRVAMSTNPNIALVGGTNLHAYDLRTGRIVHNYVDPDRSKVDYYMVANDPRSGRLISVSGDGDVLSWNQPATVGIEREHESVSGLLSPNPANDRVTISPVIEKPSMVSASVFDALGRNVLSAPSRMMVTGEVLDIDVSLLATGAYHVAMIVDGRAQHMPLVISR
ncbi:MAG: hypothetical protein H7X80_05900, partial [bacterium]|nr:hypothetical protein [Candidatus Kapabacteria bacterium]